MNRHFVPSSVLAALLCSGVLWPACSSADGKAADRPKTVLPPIAVDARAATEQPVVRYIRATGTLLAEDQASVSAEVAGRVVATPIERGTSVPMAGVLIRLSPDEVESQAKEAEANAAQIEARLGLTSGAFDVNLVPEVQHAKASFDLAQEEFARIRRLLDERVVSQSEFGQRRTQVEASRQQYEGAKNGAAQQYQALQAARARVTLARKAVADTVVRAPFPGLVAERLVSVGDYVTKGARVAVVVRVNPLRAKLTVPEQFVSAMAVGAPISLEVDAYPGRVFTGTLRFIAPLLETTQRALTVEAVVPNDTNELKPGLFANAKIELPTRTPAILVPATAVHTSGGTSRVYVITGDRAEARIVTLGPSIDDLVEISNGLAAGERVATKNVATLADGARVS